MPGIGIGLGLALAGSSYAERTPEAPVNVSPPTISGTARVGETLTASAGTWTGYPAPSYSYQWKRDGNSIIGATNSTYQLVAADYGAVITVTVTATNSEGSSSETSAGTSAVAGLAPVNTAAPVISGTPKVGESLSVTTGTWTGVPTPSISYQWTRDESDIPGATGSTYTLIEDDEDAMIGCRVTATNAEGSDSADAEEVGPVEAAPDYEYGPELVTNGDFADGTTGWTGKRGTLSVVDGRLVITDTEVDYPVIEQEITVTPGSIYEISCEFVYRGDTAYEPFVEVVNGSEGGVEVLEALGPGRPLLFTIVASGSTITLMFVAETDTIGQSFSIGPVSVREIINMAFPLAPAPTALPPAEDQTIPSVGTPVAFGDYGNTILRLGEPIHGYATYPCFNADQTRILLNGSGYPYKVVNVDGTTYRASITGGDIDYHQLHCWDTVDPDIIWGGNDGPSGSSLVKYNVATNTAETIVVAGSWNGLKIGEGEGAISDDGRYIALTGHKTGDNNAYVLVFNTETEEVDGTLTLAGWGYGDGGLDAAKISPSGDYIVLVSDYVGDPGIVVYDRATLTRLHGNADLGGHADIGYRADGSECVVVKDGRGNIVSMRLSDGDVRIELRRKLIEASGWHVSCQNRNRKGWAFVSMLYDGDAAVAPLDRGLFALRLDGRQTIETWGQPMFGSVADYDLEAHACASPNGDMLVMASGWGGTTPEAYLVTRPEVMP